MQPTNLTKFLDIPEHACADADLEFTTEIDAAVKLRMINAEDDIANTPPTTVYHMLTAIVKTSPNHNALAYKVKPRDPTWQFITYQEYFEQALSAAKSFIRLGLQPFQGVSIIGFNSPEWLLSDLGAIFAGGVPLGIYATNSAEACKFIIEDSKTAIVVVENEMQMKKILEIQDEVSSVKAIIQYKGELSNKGDDMYTWAEFMALGADVSDEDLCERITALTPNRCCTMVYTSGTTGMPKGVMLSHDNVTWTTKTAARYMRLGEISPRVGISYLPLSHAAGQLLDVFVPLSMPCTVYFAQPDALKGSLVHTMREARPTIFFGVPRVWEKMHEKMKEISRTLSGFKQWMGQKARDIGLRGSLAMMNHEDFPWGWSLANKIVLSKIKEQLGLDRCCLAVSGAAPITVETLEFFMSVNIQIYEVFGMSESTGPQTLATPSAFRIPSVGRTITGFSTQLVNIGEDGSGEICLNGRNVFMGYLNNEEKTREAIDESGLLHSGDLGRFDDDGFLSVTGRIKELIITAGGENVAPVPIEMSILHELPCLSNCMVVGDKRKFLSVLLTIANVPNGMVPTDQLTDVAISWFKEIGLEVKTVGEVVASDDERLKSALNKGIATANAKAISRASYIQKYFILPRDFSMSGGELGPTLKLRRPIASKMYASEIENLYAE